MCSDVPVDVGKGCVSVCGCAVEVQILQAKGSCLLGMYVDVGRVPCVSVWVCRRGPDTDTSMRGPDMFTVRSLRIVLWIVVYVYCIAITIVQKDTQDSKDTKLLSPLFNPQNTHSLFRCYL